MATDNQPTLTEIAARIRAHLKRFESDKKINAMDKEYGTAPFYGAHAYRGGRFVRVVYVSYQGASSLTTAEALAYLQKLDSGFVGRHFEALRKERVAARTAAAPLKPPRKTQRISRAQRIRRGLEFTLHPDVADRLAAHHEATGEPRSKVVDRALRVEFGMPPDGSEKDEPRA